MSMSVRVVAVRQRRGSAHGAAEIVGVRLNREDLDVHRQPIAVARRRTIALPGGDVDRLAAKAQARPAFASAGLIGEEQPDAHLHRLRLPGRLQVQLHDEVAARLQAPGRMPSGDGRGR